MTSFPHRSAPTLWINLGAIAILVATLIYLFLWPGPEGLPLVKVGLSPKPIAIEATVSGIKDTEAEARFQPGATFHVIVDNAPEEPIRVKQATALPNSVTATLRTGAVQAQADPRPEMQFSKNLMLQLEGQGYANGKGYFIGLKRVRIGSTIRIVAPDFETQASVVGVTVNPA